VGQGYASAFRTLTYLMRPSEPLTAAKWYWKALMWPGDRIAAAKGIVASVLRYASRRRAPGSAENATANV